MKKTKVIIGIVVVCFLGAMFAHHHVHANETSPLKVYKHGEGQPVILIPGLTCSAGVWHETLQELGAGYEYHVFTLPGFADNPPLANVEDGFFKQTKQLLFDYIDENNIEKPIIIGHSLGGFMALNMAIERPDLPSKLVIVDALPFLTAIQMPYITSAEQAEPMAANMKQMMISNANQSEEERLAFQKQMLASMIINEDKIDLAAHWGVESDVKTVAQSMYEMYTTDIRSELDKVKAPTLVLGAWIAYKSFGVTRESTLANFESQYAKLDGVQIDLTDKGNHFIMWDDPEFFNSWLKKFL